LANWAGTLGVAAVKMILEEGTQEPEVNTSISNGPVGELKVKTVDSLTSQLDQLFAKLQHNLAHNSKVFEERATALLAKLSEAESQLKRALEEVEVSDQNALNETIKPELEPEPAPAPASEPTTQVQAQMEAAESIALSEDVLYSGAAASPDRTTDIVL
jgi:hypothetical protein